MPSFMSSQKGDPTPTKDMMLDAIVPSRGAGECSP
jgi:hypothetical protein